MNETPRPLTVGSLFAGVGGFEIAADRAGLEVLWQSEYDTAASGVLAERFPDIPNYGDIHAIRIGDPDEETDRVQLRPFQRGSRSREPGEARDLPDPPRDDRSDAGSIHDDPTGGEDEPNRTAVPRVDVLVGGFPCQDYSVAGSRGGLAGDRGALWWQYLRLIDEGSPEWIIGENVPGLLTSNGGRDFQTIIDSLTERGYRVAWRVLDAQHFGVPQRRRRVFIVGHIGNGSPSQVLALAEGSAGYPPPSRGERPEPPGDARRSARDSRLLADTGIVRTLKARFGTSGSDLDDAEAGHLIPFTQNSRDEIRVIDESGGGKISAAITGPGTHHRTLLAHTDDNPDPVPFRKVNAAGQWTEGVNTLRSRDYKGDSQVLVTPPTGTTFLNARQNPITADELCGSLDTCGHTSAVAYDEYNDSISPDTHHTLRAYTKQSTGVVDGLRVRRLTPVECERLQGFPDGWTESQSDTQRYKQMGNAVAVPVVEWIMERLAAEHRHTGATT